MWRMRMVEPRITGLYHSTQLAALSCGPACRRRALELLASCPNGGTEAFMLAHGFTIEVLVELVRGGLATAQTERVVALNMVPSCTTVGRFCLADSRLTGAELISLICRERSGHRRRPGMARLPIWRTLASRGRGRTYSSWRTRLNAGCHSRE
jgi:hypothetical protein